MACKYKGRVWDNGWCNVACSYCTATQEANCEHNRQTNGDRIRSMSNEDLIEWAKKQIGYGFEFFPCGIVCDGKCDTFTDEDCKAKILEWQEKPAEDE